MWRILAPSGPARIDLSLLERVGPIEWDNVVLHGQ
jgi:hypothetical protein